ncbi:MAG: LysR family transcriptional regulator [Nitrospiraceae bacterium]|nr:LysR family transcriptional regulator [Nitrospiraceae bacterium]
MDIHQLKVFCSVYRNRSFSKASQDLLLSQPTISDHVKTLEEDLDSRLFDRLGRSIAPTREAIALYPRAVEIIEKLEAIRADMKQHKTVPGGELLLGASATPGTYLVPRAAASFNCLYPGIFFKLAIRQSRAIINMVMEHELTLGVVSDRMERKSLDFTPLADEELTLACCPDVIPGDSIAPGELTGVPLVLREEGSGTRRTMDNYLQSKGIPPGKLRVVASFSSERALIEAMKAGLGACVLPRLCVAEEFSKGSLKEVKIKGFKMQQRFYIVTHRKRTIPLISKLFIEHLRGTVDSGPPAPAAPPAAL